MITYYLRFPDQATWLDKAAEAGIRTNKPELIEDEKIDEDTGEIIPAVYEDHWSWHYYTLDWAVDDIGIIYNDDGVYDNDTGEVVTPPTPMDGWHVNYVGALPDGWDQYLVSPQQPYRVFAS
jgi:hypothetical protein